MSAFVDDEEHFLRWSAKRGLKIRPDSFLPRSTYGEYLSDVLCEAEIAAARGRQLLRMADEVIGLDLLPNERGAVLKLKSGKSVRADKIVLALGNQSPADPLLKQIFSVKTRDTYAIRGTKELSPR